jgi:hypothetical protein
MTITASPATPTYVEDPKKTLGIVGLVLAVLFPLAGLIVCLVARNRSRAAGFTNRLAKVGVIAAIVLIAVSIVISGLIVAVGVAITGDATLLAP